MELTIGQIVCLVSNPSLKGAVIKVLPGFPEPRVEVFVNGKTQTFYASQLQAEKETGDDFQFLSCDTFHAHLTALQIRHPSLSTLYSLNAARVDFIPYQFRPVLKFIRADRPRLLIADGVGVGKTIEAGLILRELQARRDIQSFLIICPRPLVTERKWQNEMKRFDERFTHLDGPTLRYCMNEMHLEGVWPQQHQRTILPYSLFDEALLYGSNGRVSSRHFKGLLDLDPPPRFDVVIVDEAHHIRNQSTYSHQAVRFFCDNAEAAIFLTATPIQLGSHDLFVLMNVLRPDLIRDFESFQHMAEPNPFINQAVNHIREHKPDWTHRTSGSLEQAGSTQWGQAILRSNPEFKRIKVRLSEGLFPPDERVQLISDIEGMHTFSGIVNRTRRRDIGAFTIRKPDTVVVEFTAEQKQLHDELLQVQAEKLRMLHGDINVKFLMSMIRRQAASCLHGLAPFLEDILRRHLDELEWVEADNSAQIPTENTVDSIESQIQEIIEKARSLDPYDPKLEAVRKIILDKQKLPNNKVMLFSSFRHTLRYLYAHLSGDDFRVGLIHGGTPDEERVELRRRFEGPRQGMNSLDVLLFSEIGCEGLDYQFCDCIVNYDLPWNPMRVEQRIGRIDRVGQKSETVAIVNLITPGTVDADIYERCLVRIGVFNSALGASEEILGDITREIRNIAENFTLSDSDRRAQFQQLADNKIRMIQEQEKLEEKQMELFGIRLPEDRMKRKVEDASSFWLTPKSIQRLVKAYLQNTCGKDQEFILGDKPLKTLRLSQDARKIVLRDFTKSSRIRTSIYREWETWLKGGDPHLSITFESDCAVQHPRAVFIMPLHPLVKQASLSFGGNERVFVNLQVKDDEAPVGSYEFAIYEWRFHGIREDLKLKAVASSEGLTTHLDRLLEKAVDGSSTKPLAYGSQVWDELDAQHYSFWNDARAKHRVQTQELVAYRRESLAVSHRARLALLEEQLEKAEDERLQRMRRSQVASAKADYARREEELDTASTHVDITAEAVAYGTIEVRGGA